ncbi:hypothetical protein LWI28_003519 [Acer negundo]|uniref:Uncharacterized protein n=1 Tax=Acer negundo TaxID=4023 RepID=A0AAD5J4A2_ACENE|nr:hypothetical protein LWI28_003519 [Acer negundo]
MVVRVATMSYEDRDCHSLLVEKDLKEATKQLAHGIAPPIEHDLVDHTYTSHPYTTLESTPQTQAKEIYILTRDSKRKLTRETTTRKVAKTAAGTSTSNAPRLGKVVTVEVRPVAHAVRIRVDDPNELDDDQRTLSDLISREMHSKSRSDLPSAAYSPDHLIKSKLVIGFPNQLIEPKSMIKFPDRLIKLRLPQPKLCSLLNKLHPNIQTGALARLR